MSVEFKAEWHDGDGLRGMWVITPALIIERRRVRLVWLRGALTLKVGK